jgi:glycerol uptake facilitator-like aquaporin
LVIVAAYWFTSSTSFANPAVTLARGFTTTFAGIAINHVPAFVIAQIIGALGAAAISGVLFSSAIGERREAGDATQAIAPGE